MPGIGPFYIPVLSMGDTLIYLSDYTKNGKMKGTTVKISK